MKIYNKKGLLSGVICTLLGVWSIFGDFGNPNHNLIVQIRDIVLSIVLLSVGITSFWQAFSKKATKEDFIEENDERNKLIVYKSKSRMLDIVYGILFIVMICGMVGFKMTANMIWFSIFIIPGFLLGLFVLIEIFVKLYYEKHE